VLHLYWMKPLRPTGGRILHYLVLTDCFNSKIVVRKSVARCSSYFDKN